MAEFRWFGHNCVRVRAKEATILTDPVGKATGFPLPKQSADIVTLANDHPANHNLDAVRPEHKTVRGPGEYELHDVFVTGVRTYTAEPGDPERKHNTAYLFEVEGMRVCHLGDIGAALSGEQAETLADVDVLTVPAGGAPLTVAKAAELVSLLGPKLVIPVRYAAGPGDASLGGLDAFCKALGVEVPAPEEKLVVKSGDLGDALRVVALAPGA